MSRISDKKYSDKERWICIYPAYINSKKTVAEGRRIPKIKSIENPTCAEMLEALSSTGLNASNENKSYCRERGKEPCYQGRIRVQIKNDDESICNPKYPTRESIMLHISANIPKLKTRVGKSGGDHHAANQTKKKTKGGRR